MRARGERGVVLDRYDPTPGADHLGQHRRIVAGAGADLHDPLAGAQVEMIEIVRPEARQSIIEPAGLVDADQNIVAEPMRLVVRRREKRFVQLVRHDAPGTRSEKALPRHGRERGDYLQVALDRRPQSQVFRVPAARRRQICVH